MSRLNELLRHVKAEDAGLGEDLEREVRMLSSRRAFGLNFERHRPEAVELPNRPVRRGDKVRIQPERGTTKSGDLRLWLVQRIHRVEGQRLVHIVPLYTDPDTEEPETRTEQADDLLVVAEFRDPIYPGLAPTGHVARDDADKPAHTVINGENYHVLNTLTYTHRGKVDAIYIDPPYNTGARDWKYNNDYVDSEDLYRHSKWLAFMERRLQVAKELLNPEDSVLIVTIDEKEVHRLALLLEQTFPEAKIQTVSSIINPKGSSRRDQFSRADEYLFFVMMGAVQITPSGYDMTLRERRETTSVRWAGLMRQGANGRRTSRPNLFYPIFVDDAQHRVHSVGDAIELEQSRQDVQPPDGTTAVWPISRNGGEATWGRDPESLRAALEEGYVKIGRFTPGNERCGFSHLQAGQIKALKDGSLRIIGRDADGSLKVEYSTTKRRTMPTTAWHQPSHSASEYGSTLLTNLLPYRRFPFPKSLYAVEDALRFFVKDKPDAVVLDFFAGSGTTAHAVMRLNRQDGGRRQCISVTNNEVAAEEHTKLRSQGLRPGDAEWEALGICDFVTKPRIEAAITGRTPEGGPIKGDYRFTDEFPMMEGFEENAEFFTLTYEAPIPVGHNRAFSRIAPLLWLRAGAQGPRIDTIPEAGWAATGTYGVLFDLDEAGRFAQAMETTPQVRVAYVVTDDERRFQAVAQRLPDHVEPVRLYESYLSNFRFVDGD